MPKVKGVDVVIKIGTDLLGGQRSATLNRAGETIDVTTKDSNGWKESEPGLKEWSIDCDGLFVESDTAYEALETAFLNGDKVSVELGMPSGLKYSGQAIITDFPLEAPYDDNVSYSVAFAGDGELTKTPGA